MLCQQCGEREATVKVMKVINGMRETQYLCQKCASELGDWNLNRFLSDMQNPPAGLPGNRRLTQRGMAAMTLAGQLARERHSAYIRSEHLLLALFLIEDGLAAKMLSALHLEKERLSQDIDNQANYGERFLGLAPSFKRALQLGVEESHRMGVNFMDTEHMLIGLAAEEESWAAQWLREQAGADANKLRNLLSSMLQQSSAGSGESVGDDMELPDEEGEEAPSRKGSKTPVLDKFSRDLTELARLDKLDPVIGRAKEIQRVIQILSRRTKNNPCLIGEPGVGKTAIVEGLAQLIEAGQVPETLIGKRVMAVDMPSLVAGSKFRGEFEERLKRLIEEIRSDKNVVLFIDEVHTIVGAGAAEGALDAANILKPALSRGELQCIGATTLDEYRKSIEEDSALERRFQSVIVGEPSVEDALAILHGLRDRYEAHHRVQISDEALDAAVRLSARYIPERFLPDKAIDLIDEAASKCRLTAYTAPPDLKELEAQLEAVQKEKDAAVNAQEFEKAAELRDREKTLAEAIEAGRKGWQQQKCVSTQVVGKDEIAAVLSDWTGIPVARLNQAESEKLLHLEELLHQRVIGQEEAISAVSRAVRRARAGLKDAKRPIGSFIFMGPTGVGKTELAKALADVMFGSEEAMVRIDMSEYMEKYNVSRLVGAPPGYVGYDEGGQLTEAVRRKPYCVVLLDEVEKAHPDVFNLLLQVLEDGRLTDSGGRVVDFRNTIIIMTTNVGASATRSRALGFGAEDDGESDYRQMSQRMQDELKQVFRPEFLNRLEETIVFRPLTEEQIRAIAALMLKDLRNRMADRELELTAGEDVCAYLAREGFDAVYGARPLRRAILRLLEDPISEGILSGLYPLGSGVEVTVVDDALHFRRVANAAATLSPLPVPLPLSAAAESAEAGEAKAAGAAVSDSAAKSDESTAPGESAATAEANEAGESAPDAPPAPEASTKKPRAPRKPRTKKPPEPETPPEDMTE